MLPCFHLILWQGNTPVFAVYVTPRFTTSEALTRFEAGGPASKRVSVSSFKAGQILNCMAYCVDRAGVQARATCSHGDRYDAALTETLTLGYSENWTGVTARDEKLCFHLSVHSKLELDCI